MHCGGVGHYRRVCTRNPRRANTSRQPAANAVHRPEDPPATPWPAQQTTEPAPHPQAPYAHAALYQATPQDPYTGPASYGASPYTGPTSYSAVARASYSVVADSAKNKYERFEALPTTQVWIEGAKKSTRFLADTGANFNVISTRDYVDLGLPTAKVDPNSPMQEDPRLANGKGGGMGVKGVTRVKIATTTATTEVDLYVAKHVDQPLLSRKATLALGILREPQTQQ